MGRTVDKKPAAAAPHAAFPGVAKALSDRLAKIGLRRPEDLILHLPLRYEDETRLTPVAAARADQPALFEVTVLSSQVQFRPRRQLVVHTQDSASDDVLILRFLNFYPSQQKQMQVGARLRVYGAIRAGFFGHEIVHPRVQKIAEVSEDASLPEAMTPFYPTTAGLAQAVLRKLIGSALKSVDLTDTLPEVMRRELHLLTFEDSVHALHHPTPDVPLAALSERTHPAWQRIKFDELLAQQLSLQRAYQARRAHTAPALKTVDSKDGLLAQFIKNLPFKFTAAQQRVWKEISSDLATAHPMQRLLQGDVGSGKTVLAACALLRAVENGYQGALMAPTEILAEQHYRKLAPWMRSLGVEVAWLTGSLKRAEKARALEAIASGQAQIVVGTHALIEEAVNFAKLGLAVVDEQHRFGVRQRLALRGKGMADDSGSLRPHQLMMSATPIPRTLAMSYWADLDVSTLDELPPGRQPVTTKLLSEARRDEVIALVRSACGEQNTKEAAQVYWVCPLIEESEALQLKTAEETYARLAAELPELKVGLLHGRLDAQEKARVMAEFEAGRLQVLVSTTVIEVGVNVPRASLMVIEHAERFGLSQLHQLRGRVGRGASESACILLYSQAQPLSQTARARLKIIFENTDGFEIARQDMELRGPGEVLGSRQSGVAMLRFADINEDEPILIAAREMASRLLRDQPEVALRHLARWQPEHTDWRAA